MNITNAEIRLYSIEVALEKILDILSSPEESPLPPWNPPEIDCDQSYSQESIISNRLYSLEEDVTSLHEAYSTLTYGISEDIEDVYTDLDYLRGTLWRLQTPPNQSRSTAQEIVSNEIAPYANED